MLFRSGTIALSFMFLSVSGLMEQFRYSVTHKTETTHNLPSYSEEVNNRYEKVVVEVGNQHVNVEASEHEAVEVFGTYQSIEDELVESQDDYMLTEVKGDTLCFTCFKTERIFIYENSAVKLRVQRKKPQNRSVALGKRIQKTTEIAPVVGYKR